MQKVSLIIPAPLRSHVDGAASLQVQAMTIADVFKDVTSAHPGLNSRLLNEDGSLRDHLNVFVGDEDIRWQKGLDTPLREGDRITILTALAGG